MFNIFRPLFTAPNFFSGRHNGPPSNCGTQYEIFSRWREAMWRFEGEKRNGYDAWVCEMAKKEGKKASRKRTWSVRIISFNYSKMSRWITSYFFTNFLPPGDHPTSVYTPTGPLSQHAWQLLYITAVPLTLFLPPKNTLAYDRSTDFDLVPFPLSSLPSPSTFSYPSASL